MAPRGYGYVLSNLAIGSRPPIHEELKFDYLALCEMQWQPPKSFFPGVRVIYVPLDDDIPIPQEMNLLAWDAGQKIAKLVKQGKRVLIVCRQGRNRSGLVTAYTLMALGFSADEAIQRIRQARGSDALSNTFFEKLLRSYDQAMV